MEGVWERGGTSLITTDGSERTWERCGDSSQEMSKGSIIFDHCDDSALVKSTRNSGRFIAGVGGIAKVSLIRLGLESQAQA